MTSFELGQVFAGHRDRKRVTAVVIETQGDTATAAIAPNRDDKITLRGEDMAGWKPVQATENDWYMEAVMPSGDLFWSVYIPGFEAAWTFYTAQYPEIAEAGGYIRVGGAVGATVDALMSFHSVRGFGPETHIGLDAARAG